MYKLPSWSRMGEQGYSSETRACRSSEPKGSVSLYLHVVGGLIKIEMR